MYDGFIGQLYDQMYDQKLYDQKFIAQMYDQNYIF